MEHRDFQGFAFFGAGDWAFNGTPGNIPAFANQQSMVDLELPVMQDTCSDFPRLFLVLDLHRHNYMHLPNKFAYDSLHAYLYTHLHACVGGRASPCLSPGETGPWIHCPVLPRLASICIPTLASITAGYFQWLSCKRLETQKPLENLDHILIWLYTIAISVYYT